MRIIRPPRRVILRAVGVVLLTLLVTDRCAGRFFVRHEFAQSRTSDIRSGMRQSSLWRPHGPRDLPPPRREGEVAIGIFGGSVANGLACSSELLAAPAATDYSTYVGKPLRIVNLTMGGGREPQQYNALHMFHDAIDVAVFLDGYNEMTNPITPCDRLVPFWAANRKTALELLQPLIDLNVQLTTLADSSIWKYLSGSGLFKAYLSRLNNRSWVKTDEFARSMGDPSILQGSIFATDSERAQSWATCVALSAEYAASLNLPIFFFLQPNQYVAGSKPFSEEEKVHALHHPGTLEAVITRLASHTTSPIFAKLRGRDLTRAYAVFEEQIEQLRLRGVAVTSLSGIYKDVRGTVYIDEYCHVNDTGNAIMAQAIFEKLLAAARAKSR